MFERPVRLFLAWLALQFLLIALWSWRRDRLSARAMLGSFLAIPLFLFASLWIVTPRERVIETCESLARAVESGDLTSIADRLDDDFRTADWDRREFIDHVREALQRYSFRNVRLSSFDFSLAGLDAIEVVFVAVCQVQSIEGGFDHLRTQWRLRFHLDRSEWRILNIEPVPVPFSPIRSWRDASP